MPSYSDVNNACRIYNVFHPLDPVAYRIEPLIQVELQTLKPLLMDHHAGTRIAYQISGIKDSVKEISSKFLKWWDSLSSEKAVEDAPNNNKTNLPGILLNREERIDYVLQVHATLRINIV